MQIDEPKFKTSIRQNQLPNITSFYYLRARGRNWKKWWHHEHKDERYDYLYTSAENGQPFPEDFNPELIRRYPELKKILPAATQQPAAARIL